MSRRLFWPLIALASLLVAGAAASFAIAAFSEPLPVRTGSYIPYGYTEVFGRPTSLDWSGDRGMLIAAIMLAALSLVAYSVAARAR